ncbi:MAG: lipocalin family protein [Melioribacteraceae bacterium]|jgi:apolipoprotein D and lipocalin family protein|nr:lipocalin family protein [Melioribacteraceae bacterium]
MKKLIVMFLILAMQIFAQNNKVAEPKVVDSVNLEKYIGTWYEIAKIPNRFQSDCAKNTTATYSINSDGTLKVVNKCIEDDGEIDEAEGVAIITDTLSNAKLEVSFVSFLGWRPFWGAYWVIGLDENYEWAIVGHPERKYGWILSRTKSIDDETESKIFAILEKQGYELNKFEMSLQE